MKCAQFTTVGFHRDYLDLGFCCARKRKKRKKSHEPRLRPKLPAGRRKRSFWGPLSRATTDFVWLLIEVPNPDLIIIPGSTAVAILLVGNSAKNVKRAAWPGQKDAAKKTRNVFLRKQFGKGGIHLSQSFDGEEPKAKAKAKALGLGTAGISCPECVVLIEFPNQLSANLMVKLNVKHVQNCKQVLVEHQSYHRSWMALNRFFKMGICQWSRVQNQKHWSWCRKRSSNRGQAKAQQAEAVEGPSLEAGAGSPMRSDEGLWYQLYLLYQVDGCWWQVLYLI